MGFFSHLFWPYGFILQIAALAHFFWRRRASGTWLWIIFIGGALGAAAYLIVEVVAEADVLRAAAQRRARKERITRVEAQIVDNPSVANLEELGEMYWDEKSYAKARETFDRAIATRSASARTFYFRGRCALEQGEPAAAVPDLELAFRTEPTLDFYRGGLFLSRAYVATGREAEAATVLSSVMERTSSPEMLYGDADFLSSQHKTEEAREWLTRLQEMKRTAPRFVQRAERAWFQKGKALLKQLSA